MENDNVELEDFLAKEGTVKSSNEIVSKLIEKLESLPKKDNLVGFIEGEEITFGAEMVCQFRSLC